LPSCIHLPAAIHGFFDHELAEQRHESASGIFVLRCLADVPALQVGGADGVQLSDVPAAWNLPG
jgi:hypothetical protein